MGPVTDIVVLFPFRVPILIPRAFANAVLRALSASRIIEPRQYDTAGGPFVRLDFPFNFLTAPLIADLFLLAILAIGRQEVYDGTIEADNISPIDIMVFFLTLAYIAISIDASGLIRFLAFKILQKGGKVGPRLFSYLYTLFFALGSLIGNDPIILSGTAFLAYMTRASSNIVCPRAWIHAQFAVANIASAILVTSNPTNLVLTSAFQIKFLVYTANMIIPVVITATVLFPFLLYVIFADESLVPSSIEMHELPDEVKAKNPVNPNIPNARVSPMGQERESGQSGKVDELLSLEEILNPFLDKRGAAFGSIIMAATLITVLAVNAASHGHTPPVFWITLPAAFVLFCCDVAYGWKHRHDTREIARKGREEVQRTKTDRKPRDKETTRESLQPQSSGVLAGPASDVSDDHEHEIGDHSAGQAQPFPSRASTVDEKEELGLSNVSPLSPITPGPERERHGLKAQPVQRFTDNNPVKTTLESLANSNHRWLQETLPTVTAVVSHMPFPLVPFAFAMFILVQALVTKGWIEVFAYGWDHWVDQTGTVGAIGGMGFLSVILCNVRVLSSCLAS